MQVAQIIKQLTAERTMLEKQVNAIGSAVLALTQRKTARVGQTRVLSLKSRRKIAKAQRLRWKNWHIQRARMQSKKYATARR